MALAFPVCFCHEDRSAPGRAAIGGEAGMAQGNTVRIAVLPGDGIGQEVTAAALAVLEPLAKRHGLGLSAETLPAGAFHFRDAGEAFPEDSFRRAEAADAILLGAMGWPGIR